MRPMTGERSVPNLSRILNAGVPPGALAFYGRWWQLESWLREIVYVELRAKYGARWTEHLKGTTPKRALSDEANSYMASADAGELLAYAEVSDLFQLIEDQWELFAPLLPPKRRWQGASDELKELRNRNAHCRRPHEDDLARIEQRLRDLEKGAWHFYASYLKTCSPYESRDPLARSWIAGEHETAVRLLGHERQDEVRFRLSYSVRPWATPPNEDAICGSEGVLWHAHWTIPGRILNIADLWTEIESEPAHRDRLIHLLFGPGRATATFAAVDDPVALADAIGHIFDQILMTRDHQHRFARTSTEEWTELWTGGAERLPRSVQVDSPLTRIDPLQPAFSIFGADT
jgi:hypothetical protein